VHAAQAIPPIDAEVVEKGHLWTETSLIIPCGLLQGQPAFPLPGREGRGEGEKGNQLTSAMKRKGWRMPRAFSTLKPTVLYSMPPI
jgi:hypothetical protein